jgi:nucleoside 2-deoxyribosyltransferase
MRKRAFLAFPFTNESQAAVSLIETAAKSLHLDIVNPQAEAYAGSITSFIRDSIATADTVIAVVSEENGNVYYEIGLAHCQQKPVVLLTTDASSLKFDLQDQRAIVFDPAHPDRSLSELVAVLESALEPQSAEDFIFSAFHGISGPEIGKKLLRMVLAIHPELKNPQMATFELSQDKKEVFYEVHGFMGERIRAILDTNGRIRTQKVAA